MSRVVQEHVIKILYPLHVTGYGTLLDDDKRQVEIAGGEIICVILYIDNSEKSSFSELKKRADNYYVLNEAEYPRTVTAVQSLLLNSQTNYNSNRQSQYQGVRNQLMFSQCGKTRDDEVKTNEYK